MFVMLTVLQQTAQLITFYRWVHAVTAAAVCSLDVSRHWRLVVMEFLECH